MRSREVEMKATINVSEENRDKAAAVFLRAFEAGRLGTIGDCSEYGFLYEVFQALDVKWEEEI